MQSHLLASFGWIIDVFFFLILFFRTLIGAHRGFVVEVCKLAGKIASIIFAFMLCVSFANFLENCFGMTTSIANGIAASIAKNDAYAVRLPHDVAGSDLLETLDSLGVNAFSRWFICLGFSDMEFVPAGTTPALMIGSILAKWIANIIAFLLLIILIRLCVLFLSRVLTNIIEKLAPFRTVNRFLGALLGFLKACFLLFVVFTIMSWLPFDSLLDSTFVVGKLIRSEWFRNATSYAISGKWFTQFLSSGSK